MEAERKVNPDCVNASNPFHICAEYCAQRAHGSKPRSPGPKLVGAAQNGERYKEHRGIEGAEMNVHPSCRNASNPYHQCSDYCSPGTIRGTGQKEEKRSGVKLDGNRKSTVENGVKIDDNRKSTVENGVNLEDKRKMKEIERIEGSKTAQNGEIHEENQGIVIAERNVDEKRSVDNGVKMWDNEMVDPRCVNAANPYHVCAEYCLQKRKEMQQHTNGHKSVVVVQNVERHKEDQGIVAAERNVNPLCPNASNPYHHCAEYCSKKT